MNNSEYTWNEKAYQAALAWLEKKSIKRGSDEAMEALLENQAEWGGGLDLEVITLIASAAGSDPDEAASLPPVE